MSGLSVFEAKAADVIPLGRLPLDAICGTSGKSRAQVIAEHICHTFAETETAECAEGMLRVLAAICTVNAVNVTEALELAEALAADLGAIVQGSMEG